MERWELESDEREDGKINKKNEKKINSQALF